jgi:hypothetical protein
MWWRFGRIQDLEHPAKRRGEPLANIVALPCLELPDVDVESDARLAVPGEALHLGDVGTSTDQVCNRRVSQIVEAKLGKPLTIQTSAIGRLLEAARGCFAVVDRLAGQSRKARRIGAPQCRFRFVGSASASLRQAARIPAAT